ncbi:MAG: VanW family protein [Candidatus Uhrbacteria bacterium]|nr:VanW family protein [Candidatus Uhrbacteria bacterium]
MELNVESKEKKPRTPKQAKAILAWVGLGLAFALVFATGLSAAAYGFEKAFQNRIYPGVSVGGLRLDGFSRDQARERLQTHVTRALEPGFQFRYGDERIDVPAELVGVNDPDLSRDLIRYDVEQAVNEAYALGRNTGMTGDTLTRLSLLIRRTNLRLAPQADRSLIEQLLQEEISERVVMAEDARLELSMVSGTQALDVRVTPEREGRMGHVAQAVDTLLAQAEQLSFQPITIQSTVILPRVTAKDLEPLRSQVPAFLSRADHTLFLDGTRFEITTSTVIGWVSASPTASGAELTLDADRVAEGVSGFVKAKLVEPKDGTLQLNENGTFKEFVAPEEGIVVDGELTAQDLLWAWEHRASTSTLHLKRITPMIVGEDAERLGITELLGVGRSNFSGSPTNRRRNIALGKSRMNGVLIPPGGIFSQLNVLGEIDGAHGWLPELVIKGDKTVPEYGGGLCQVGTTSFRAALASGLPIVERRSHSYRVRYYEPAGTDATIYDPSPDFRFKNDTPGHILVTSQIQGDELLFLIWGTQDGRTTSSTKPIVYNIVSPPPTKYIPTTDLPVGQKRCTESAHAGASASFDYHIAYPDGTYKKETFNSYYRPWGAVCLIGATPEEVSASNPSPNTEEVAFPGP